MEFGVCTTINDSPAVKAAGFGFIEESAQSLLQGLLPDEQWTGRERAAGCVLPIPSANLLVPKTLRITGSDVDAPRLKDYLSVVTRRAAQLGMKTLVFGSGGARNVPDGFDRDSARRQIVAFCRVAAEQAQPHEVTIVVEPLNRGECNIVNTVSEAIGYVKEVDHPNLRCLVDSYHLWLEDEPLDDLEAAMPWIHHVHVADKLGRVAPGQSGQSDYRPLFGVLKLHGYAGRISIEGDFPSSAIARDGEKVLQFLRRQWAEA
jgi:sugar phosphate isomerase/epimerase